MDTYVLCILNYNGSVMSKVRIIVATPCYYNLHLVQLLLCVEYPVLSFHNLTTIRTTHTFYTTV